MPPLRKPTTSRRPAEPTRCAVVKAASGTASRASSGMKNRPSIHQIHRGATTVTASASPTYITRIVTTMTKRTSPGCQPGAHVPRSGAGAAGVDDAGATTRATTPTSTASPGTDRYPAAAGSTQSVPGSVQFRKSGWVTLWPTATRKPPGLRSGPLPLEAPSRSRPAASGSGSGWRRAPTSAHGQAAVEPSTTRDVGPPSPRGAEQVAGHEERQQGERDVRGLRQRDGHQQRGQHGERDAPCHGQPEDARGSDPDAAGSRRRKSRRDGEERQGDSSASDEIVAAVRIDTGRSPIARRNG